MRRGLIAGAIFLVALLGLPTAAAGVARPGGSAVVITAVTPSTTYVTATDDCGTYRLYNASVRLTWKAPVRLDVYLLPADGVRLPPGSLNLSGTGSRTVVVPGVVVPEGTRGFLLAEALTCKGKTGYQLVASRTSAEIVSFPAS